MAAARPTPIELLSSLIGFDTVSAKSNLALIRWVRDYLAEYGAAATLIASEDGRKANLVATLGPEVADGIVLSGHTDVVPVTGQVWTSDPFATREHEGRIHGRGTADMKGFIAVVLSLVPEILAAGLDRPVHLALSYDEEVGCLGAPALIRHLVQDLPRPRLAIIGEPTGMKVANRHKGIYAFRTVVSGRDGHSSLPDRGVNAIAHAARIIAYLGALAEDLRAEARDDDFTPPHTTLNVGTIEGGTALNIVPRECAFRWEFRPVPGVDPDRVAARVRAHIDKEIAPRLLAEAAEADREAVGIATEETVRVPPLVAVPDQPAETLALALTGDNRAGTASFAAEAGLFQKAGIPAVLCGPGSIEQAHQPDEYVSVAQLEACEDFLRRLIAHLRAG